MKRIRCCLSVCTVIVALLISRGGSANTLSSGYHAETIIPFNDNTSLAHFHEGDRTIKSNGGTSAVTDSIPPEDDQLLPFGSVPVGDFRTEHITIHNTSATENILVESIALDSLYYYEDFSAGVAQGWEPGNSAHWSVDNDQYIASDPSFDGLMQSMYGDAIWDDAVFETTVHQSTDSNLAYLFLRASEDFVFGGPGNAVGLAFSRNGFYFFFYQDFYGVEIVTFGESGDIFTDGTPNHVRIEMENTFFRFCFNGGEEIHAVERSAPTSGRIGVGGSTTPENPTSYHFDEVTVSAQTQFRLEGVPALPHTLTPEASATVSVVYEPHRRDSHHDAVRIITNDLSAPETVVALTGVGAGTRFYVKSDGDDSNDGMSWETAKATLQAALEAAAYGDDIWVAAGVYYPTSRNGITQPDTDRVKHFRLKSGVYLYGGFTGTETALEERDWTTNVTRLSGDIGEAGEMTDNCYHVIRNDGQAFGYYTTIRLDGFVISDGNANNSFYSFQAGGGIYGNFYALTIKNCIFENNVAHRAGGAAFIRGNNTLFINNTFTGNHVVASSSSSVTGGGLYAFGDGIAVIDCDFADNYIVYDNDNDSGSSGGGAYVNGQNIEVIRCIFSNNAIFAEGNAGGLGGGASIRGKNVVISDCVFIDNSISPGEYSTWLGGFGGGLVIEGMPGRVERSQFISNSTNLGSGLFSGGGAIANFAPGDASANTTINNCVFYDNYTNGTLGGGAILNIFSMSLLMPFTHVFSTTIMNSTFCGNISTSAPGGAIATIDDVNDTPNSLTLMNSVLYGNSPDELYVDDEVTTTVAYSNIQGGFDGEGNMDAAPLFMDAATGDLRLQAESPSVNAGDPAGVPPAPETDILGTIRPQNGRVDMGAYEYDDTPPTATITLLSPNETSADEIAFAVTFSEAIQPALTAEALVVRGTLTGGVAVTGAGAEYNVTVTLTDPDADGTVGIMLPEGVVFDPAGNPCAKALSPICRVYNWRGFLVVPEGAHLYAGDSHALEVQPDCDATTIQYQWRWTGEEKQIHDGPQTAQWLLTDVANHMSGTYWCEILYDGVLYTTTPVTVEVAMPLEIITAPEGGVKGIGESHSFAVEVAGGYLPLHYEWRKEGVAIADAPDAPAFTIATLTGDHAGYYTVAIHDSNSASTVSEGALLTLSDGMPTGMAVLAITALTLLVIGAYSTRRKRQ